MKWTDDMDKVPEGAVTTDGYVTFDLFARYEFSSRLTLNAGIFNMFDKEYIEYSSVAGREDDGTDLSPFTQPGRTFSAQLKYIF